MGSFLYMQTGGDEASREEVLDYARAICEVLGTAPRQDFGERLGDLTVLPLERRLAVLRVLATRPSVSCVKAHFGSWRAALMEAGVVPAMRRSHAVHQADAPGDEIPAASLRTPVRQPRDDRPYATTSCPTCWAQLEVVPTRKTPCPHYGAAIHVRSGPDGRRHLLRSDQVDAHEEWWVRHAQEQAEKELRETGLQMLAEVRFEAAGPREDGPTEVG
jgi:hypothetical protein